MLYCYKGPGSLGPSRVADDVYEGRVVTQSALTLPPWLSLTPATVCAMRLLAGDTSRERGEATAIFLADAPGAIPGESLATNYGFLVEALSPRAYGRLLGPFQTAAISSGRAAVDV